MSNVGDNAKERRPLCVKCFKPLEGTRDVIGTRITCYECLGQRSFKFMEEDNAKRNQQK